VRYLAATTLARDHIDCCETPLETEGRVLRRMIRKKRRNDESYNE
jgi:hypothetical protein